MEISGLVLAGGLGTRMGRINKGLLPWRGATLAHAARETLSHITQRVFISANEDLAEFEKIAPVFKDKRAGFLGPLAAFETALNHIETPWLITLPCDTPFITPAILKALIEGKPKDKLGAYAVCGSHSHPLVGIVSKEALGLVQSQLDAEDRRVMNFWKALNAQPVDLGEATEPHFRNLNTEELYQGALLDAGI